MPCTPSFVFILADIIVQPKWRDSEQHWFPLWQKLTKKIAWNECDIEMRETRGALGRLATKSLHFFYKRGDKSVACMSVCHTTEVFEIWWMYALMHLRASEWQTDRHRTNEWYQDPLSGTENSHLLLSSECVVCLPLCVCVLYLLRKPFTQMQASEALIDIWGSFHFIKSKSVFVFDCVHKWMACVWAYLPPMKC